MLYVWGKKKRKMSTVEIVYLLKHRNQDIMAAQLKTIKKKLKNFKKITKS